MDVFTHQWICPRSMFENFIQVFGFQRLKSRISHLSEEDLKNIKEEFARLDFSSIGGNATKELLFKFLPDGEVSEKVLGDSSVEILWPQSRIDGQRMRMEMEMKKEEVFKQEDGKKIWRYQQAKEKQRRIRRIGRQVEGERGWLGAEDRVEENRLKKWR